MNISRSEAGTEIEPNAVGASRKDYVVAQYDEYGRRVRRGISVGGVNTDNEAKTKMARLLSRLGGEQTTFVMSKPIPMESAKKAEPVKKGAKKKVKVKQAEVQDDSHLPLPPHAEEIVRYEEPPVTQAHSPGNIVVLNTGFGRIKVSVDAVLETEVGIALVFPNDTEVRFVPEQGHELTLTFNSRDTKVMYLGLLFSWHASQQKIMTFIKSDI